jgi:hypothetical protein
METRQDGRSLRSTGWSQWPGLTNKAPNSVSFCLLLAAFQEISAFADYCIFMLVTGGFTGSEIATNQYANPKPADAFSLMTLACPIFTLCSLD